MCLTILKGNYWNLPEILNSFNVYPIYVVAQLLTEVRTARDESEGLETGSGAGGCRDVTWTAQLSTKAKTGESQFH